LCSLLLGATGAPAFLLRARGREPHQHRGQRHARLVPGAGQREVARREDVLDAAARAQVALDGLHVRLQRVFGGVAQRVSTSTCSWCRSGSPCTVISLRVSAASSLSTGASSAESARATSGLTRSSSGCPATSAASLRTSAEVSQHTAATLLIMPEAAAPRATSGLTRSSSGCPATSAASLRTSA